MEYHHWSIWDEIWLTSGISTDPYGNTDPFAFSSRDDDMSIKNCKSTSHKTHMYTSMLPQLLRLSKKRCCRRCLTVILFCPIGLSVYLGL